MKQLKDYLHLYLGCECWDVFNDCQVTLTPKSYYGYLEHWMEPDDGQIKPILRPLSDMTEEESIRLKLIRPNIVYGAITAAAMTQYLLSKHFDLFGLIEAGLAIDKTTLIKSPE